MTASIETWPKVYRLAKGWKWFLLIGAPPLICLFGWLAMLPFTPGHARDVGSILFLLPLGGGFCVFLLYGLISALKTRLEIDAKEVRLVGLFKTAVMPLDEIAGFRIVQVKNGRILVLAPKNPAVRKIKIELYFERQAELLAWAQNTLVNLDSIQYRDELMEIFQNDSIGTTPEEKAGYYKRAKSCCRVLNGASIVALFWAMFRPQPYVLAASVSLLLPWIALLVLAFFRGVVKIDGKPKSAYPTVGAAFLLPGLCLAMRGLLDWHVLEWNHFWGPFAILSASLLASALLLAKDARKVATAILWGVFCAVYGYGGTVVLNGILATARPAAYRAEVVGKSISTGKQTLYYLKLSPWGNRTQNEDVTVTRSVYAKYAAGATAVVWVREGRFKMPFYFVR